MADIALRRLLVLPAPTDQRHPSALQRPMLPILVRPSSQPSRKRCPQELTRGFVGGQFKSPILSATLSAVDTYAIGRTPRSGDATVSDYGDLQRYNDTPVERDLDACGVPCVNRGWNRAELIGIAAAFGTDTASLLAPRPGQFPRLRNLQTRPTGLSCPGTHRPANRLFRHRNLSC